MNSKKLGVSAAAALIIGHCIGQIDLVALPVWVGALIERYGFSPQQAGGLATLFLIGAFVASVLIAPRFHNVNQRFMATAAFALAALSFYIATMQTGFGTLAALHLVAGLSIGVALSMVDGAMGLTSNPHRMFAVAGFSLGVLAVVFMGVVPQLLISRGGPAIFEAFAVLMAFASVVCFVFFRNPAPAPREVIVPFSRATWFVLLGTCVLTLNQSMVFAFVEVIGKSRDFGAEAVIGALIAVGIVNCIFPAPLAGLLEKRLSAFTVTQAAPFVHAGLALLITMATVFSFWAPAAALFVSVHIFTVTFVFGLLAKLDPSGRANASLPATIMAGSALGPIFGGMLGGNFGFGALGLGSVVVCLVASALFVAARRIARQSSAVTG